MRTGGIVKQNYSVKNVHGANLKLFKKLHLNYSILFYPITLGGRRGNTDGKVHSCPLFDIVFPPLFLSASFSFSFHCAL